MARRKHGAAVLVGQAAGFISADLFGNVNDLYLIIANQRTEHRHTGHRVRTAQRVQRLAGHLAQAFAGNQRLGALLLGDLGRNAHHKPAHHQRAIFFGAFFMDLQLRLGKGHNIELHPAAIGG